VERFVEMLKNAKAQGFNPKYIKFWGGELLVYWKTVKALLPEINKLYECHDTKYSTTTNGFLLTKEIVDTLNEYNFNLNVSHNGTQDLGEKDLFDDPEIIETLKYASEKFGNRFSFMSINTETAPDLCRKFNKFDSTLGNKKSNIAIVALRWNETNKDHLKDFDKSAKDAISDSLYKCMLSNDYTNRVHHVSEYYTFKQKLMTHASIETSRFICNYPDNGLIVDLKGNVYNCSMRPQKNGTLENINEFPSTGNISWHYRKDCPTCPFIHLCGGGCVRQKNGWEHELTCANSYYPMYKGLFKAAFKDLFNVDVVEINGTPI
jgi:uncharacterized protein